MDTRALLESTYRAALAAVSPAALLRPHLQGPRPDFILSVGKAALPMAQAALAAYPDVEALIIAPRGSAVPTLARSAQVRLTAHPVPDESSVQAGQEALERVASLRAGQQVLVLVSGGASALMSAPDGVTLAQKQALTTELLRAGADIHEMNTVRRHLSAIKGGRLAQATAAQVRALLISDVIGDDPAVIASGPTVADPTTFAQALNVLDKYKLAAAPARAHFVAGLAGQRSDTPSQLPNVRTILIGSNRLLLAAAATSLERQGVRALILSDTFGGEARELAGFHAAVARSVQRYGSPASAPVVLLSGGEATVTVRGNGVGGRNQEFALWLLVALAQTAPSGAGLHVLSAGSDGIDGSSAAAGAFLTPDSWARAQASGLDAREFLARNDSGSFFEHLGDQLMTGPSGHNLNDFRALAIGL